MICKKCKKDISPDCCYDKVCVFCYHNITEWESNGQIISYYEAIRPIICIKCQRTVINQSWLTKNGCKWCDISYYIKRRITK